MTASVVATVLWADLSRNELEFESPAWHEVVLKERKERLRKGEETPVDWNKEKHDLRKQLRGQARLPHPELTYRELGIDLESLSSWTSPRTWKVSR